jgi:hypothetical protein
MIFSANSVLLCSLSDIPFSSLNSSSANLSTLCVSAMSFLFLSLRSLCSDLCARSVKSHCSSSQASELYSQLSIPMVIAQ